MALSTILALPLGGSSYDTLGEAVKVILLGEMQSIQRDYYGIVFTDPQRPEKTLWVRPLCRSNG